MSFDGLDVPPDVLKFLLKVQQYVNTTVEILQPLPGTPSLSASGTITSAGSADLQIVQPAGIPSGEAFGQPSVVEVTVAPTWNEEEVSRARTWWEQTKAIAVKAGKFASVLAAIGTLIDFGAKALGVG